MKNHFALAALHADPIAAQPAADTSPTGASPTGAPSAGRKLNFTPRERPASPFPPKGEHQH